MEDGLREPGAGGGRALTPDDLLWREELGEVALSPDGRWLAYVVKRPRATARFHKYEIAAVRPMSRRRVVSRQVDDPSPATGVACVQRSPRIWKACISPRMRRSK